MGYRTQPLVAVASLTSTVAINTDTTTVLIAAPAAGFRLRIVGWQFAAQQSVTGNLRVIGRSHGSAAFIITAGVLPGGGVPFYLPDPGESCDPAQSFDLIYASNVASQTLRALVHYFLDAIS